MRGKGRGGSRLQGASKPIRPAAAARASPKSPPVQDGDKPGEKRLARQAVKSLFAYHDELRGWLTQRISSPSAEILESPNPSRPIGRAVASISPCPPAGSAVRPCRGAAWWMAYVPCGELEPGRGGRRVGFHSGWHPHRELDSANSTGFKLLSAPHGHTCSCHGIGRPSAWRRILGAVGCHTSFDTDLYQSEIQRRVDLFVAVSRRRH